MTLYVLKRTHYTGGESVIQRSADEAYLRDKAHRLNTDYHSGQYYVEEWDDERFALDVQHMQDVIQRVFQEIQDNPEAFDLQENSTP